jgi:DNA-binding transcriptional regulator GbsR (MarR family)
LSEPKFDPEVYLIEDDIISHFLSSPIFANRDPLFIKILLLFITRKNLTQKTIQDVTGMSAGKISEEVNVLLDMGLIEIEKKSKTGKITYSANSAGMVLLNFTGSIIEKLVKWENELRKMKEELEAKRPQLNDLNGYERLYQNVKQFSILINKYKELRLILKKNTQKN